MFKRCIVNIETSDTDSFKNVCSFDRASFPALHKHKQAITRIFCTGSLSTKVSGDCETNYSKQFPVSKCTQKLESIDLSPSDMQLAHPWRYPPHGGAGPPHRAPTTSTLICDSCQQPIRSGINPSYVPLPTAYALSTL